MTIINAYNSTAKSTCAIYSYIQIIYSYIHYKTVPKQHEYDIALEFNSYL